MARAQHRGGIFWPPSTPAVTGPIPETTLRSYAIYWDIFDETLAAGSVDETDSTDENALREVYDTLNDLVTTDVDDGICYFYLNGLTGDPCIWHKTLASGAWPMWNGYAVYWKLRGADPPALRIGLDENVTSGLSGAPVIELYAFGPSDFGVRINGSDALLVIADSTITSFMIVRRPDSAGYFYFYRTGAEPWKLFWTDEGPLIG